jgi:hypothetical protein
MRDDVREEGRERREGRGGRMKRRRSKGRWEAGRVE